MKSRPFLKWAGNKYRLLERISRELPHGKRLIEPFVGSGAVFLNLDYQRYLLAETNPDLINLYNILKSEGQDFIEYARSFMNSKNNTEQRYYALRDEFNATDDPRKKSALFVYLNRHGYNGLCRYNQAWKFNVPFGSYTKPHFPEQQLEYFHQRAKRARFVCQDFRVTLKKAKTGDVIYCDPPYAALTPTANFTHYGGCSFTEADQRDLVTLAKDCQARGISVIISNHDTPFTRKLYSGAVIKGFHVSRTISQNASSRQPVKELLAIYHSEIGYEA